MEWNDYLANLIQSKVVNLSVKINSPMSNLTSKAVDGYTFDVRLKLNSYQNIGTTSKFKQITNDKVEYLHIVLNS
jgi:hypothetical protein